MFTQLFDIIFPKLGEIFGAIVEIADMPFASFLLSLSDGMSRLCSNLFTGEAFLLEFNGLGVFGGILSTILSFLAVPSIRGLSTWLALLYLSFTLFIGVAVVKFFVGLFK